MTCHVGKNLWASIKAAREGGRRGGYLERRQGPNRRAAGRWPRTTTSLWPGAAGHSTIRETKRAVWPGRDVREASSR